ncbi:MAG TPA: RsmD family RNA methyltransferase [Candidatus Saccharimonadales bacterium]|nr:RsmD family RNA methyltransferase [Candidatus Saccharimonadales bacterium]
MKKQITEIIELTKIVGGGQTLGQLDDGRKIFVWGGLPGEEVEIESTKLKSSHAEGVVTKVIKAAPERVEPKDADSYLSTSPWQIMDESAEAYWKKQLVRDAFAMQHIELPEFELIGNDASYHYRNKVEFSWYWDNESDQLELSFFRRGTHGKIPVQGTALALPAINNAAVRLRDILRARKVEARALKTALIRCDQNQSVVVQLYVKDKPFTDFSPDELATLAVAGFELIYSNPRSPASVITQPLQESGNGILQDTLLDTTFRYACEGFFQVNLPVYTIALEHMKKWTNDRTVVDMYSGVGTIGLTIGGDNVTLVEQNQACIEEMEQNISRLGAKATAIHAASEDALDYITGDKTIILDPPRAGLHTDVIDRLLEVKPARVIYLSCNPVTQARDIEKLLPAYKIIDIAAYNFFPRTPHIENLIVLEAI